MSITEFLLARIAEDEADTINRVVLRTENRRSLTTDDAEKVHAECAAKRAIVELADDANSLDMSVDNDRRVGWRDEAVEPYCGDSILYALAAVYADHPEYQDEWRVGA